MLVLSILDATKDVLRLAADKHKRGNDTATAITTATSAEASATPTTTRASGSRVTRSTAGLEEEVSGQLEGMHEGGTGFEARLRRLGGGGRRDTPGSRLWDAR